MIDNFYYQVNRKLRSMVPEVTLNLTLNPNPGTQESTWHKKRVD